MTQDVQISPNLEQNMFSLEVVNVFRDFVQGLYANRIPLDHPLVLEIFKLWDEIAKESTATLKLSTIEVGGADPQVSAEYRNIDYLEVYRRIREIAPFSILRPLWRGANGFLLKPSHPKDLEHLLTTLAKDVADADLSPIETEELLRVKIFDSQGIMRELQSSVDIIAKLRGQGHAITPEIGIPYSKGEAYPDELYVQKAREAAQMLQKAGIPLHLCRISLKDMVGELEPNDAERLVGKIIDALKEEKLEIPLGLHLHHTGHATHAYAEAIKACKHKKYPLVIDTVECDPFSSEFTAENAWRNTGFASLLEVDKLLKTQNIDIGLTPSLVEKLEHIGDKTLQLARLFKIRRADSALSGKELRDFHIPGGAFASFSTAVNSMGENGEGLAKLLNISEQEALRIAGHALNAVGRLMGQPFAVTPGFQNKQIAAINLLQNMIHAGMLVPGNVTQIQETVLKTLSDDQVDNLFLKNLPEVVQKFLTGEMPAETVAEMAEKLRAKNTPETEITKLLGNQSATVHPRIRAVIPRRHTLLTEGLEQKELKARPVVIDLLNQGRIKPTITQARNLLNKLKNKKKPHALFASMSEEQSSELLRLLEAQSIIYNRPDGTQDPWLSRALGTVEKYFLENNTDPKIASEKAKVIVTALKEKTIDTHISWALELDDINKFIAAIDHPWPREANPEMKEGYAAAVEKSRKGRNPVLDELELMFEWVNKDKLSASKVAEYQNIALAKENTDIEASVCQFVIANQVSISNVVSGSSDEIEIILDNLYEQQKKIIKDKEKTGKYFLLPEKRRLDIALHHLNNTLDTLTKKQNQFKQALKTKRHEKDSIVLTATSPGKLLHVFVDPSKGPVRVKKGDPLFTIEVMKASKTIRAKKDGVIDNIKLPKNGMIQPGDELAYYQKKPNANTHSNVKNMAALDLQEIKKRQETCLAESKKLGAKLTIKLNHIHAEAGANQSIFTPSDDVMQQLNKTGYNAKPITIASTATFDPNEIHIINNRAGCAAKLYADLKQAGCQVRILYVKDDASTPIIANVDPSDTILIDDYKNHDSILNALRNQTKMHTNNQFYLHPGWGFLSEDYSFVAKVEALQTKENLKVKFVGPPSHAMELAGDKLEFRKLVDRVSEKYKFKQKFNPEYLANHACKPEELLAYINSNFNPHHSLDTFYRAHYKDIKEKMGGDVAIKAVAGGGGKGIEFYKINPSLTDEENYRNYVILAHKNSDYAEKHFGNGKMLTEQFARGMTRHLEVQFATTKKGSHVFGFRDCTLQDGSQKVVETNVIQGDYPPELLRSINEACKQVTAELAAEGHTGVGTLEMLVLPDGKVVFLEINTRIQVEHMVTEDDIREKTGKNISLPLINFLFTKYADQQPEEILKREFGLEPHEIMRFIHPGEQRITHLRLNSREIDGETGESIGRYFYDFMWAGCKAIYNIFENFGARIIVGGIGKGGFDGQTGATSGKEADVLQAGHALAKLVEVARTSYRSDGTLSLNFVLEFYPLLYNKNGNFSPNISTKTFNAFLKAIEDKQVTVELETEQPTVTPRFKSGAMEKAFNEFLALQPGYTHTMTAKL